MNGTLLSHYFSTHQNLGDILYYLLVKQLFCDEEIIIHHGACSINTKTLPFLDNICALNIKTALKNSQELSHLMIGGGAIIRRNKSSSFRTTSVKYSKVEQFLTSVVKSKYTSSILESAYSSLRLPPGTIGPFLLDVGPQKSYGYVSAGFAGTMSQLSTSELESVFGNAKYVYVRDRIAYQYLLDHNISANLYYAPDLAVLTDILLPIDSLVPHYLSFRAKVKLQKEKYLLIQSNNSRVNNILQDFNAATCIANDLDAQIIPFAMAEVHGDDDYAERFAKMLDSHYSSNLTFLERIAAIAFADFFVGTSMHGCVLSFTYGRRFLPLDPSSIKISQLVATLSESHPQSKRIVRSFSDPTSIAFSNAMYDDLLNCKQQATDMVRSLVETIRNIIVD
jgi:polysaccharide pyruvyl transferase WcaK-like protein